MLLEKMINIDYNKLSEKSVISTSFYGIRCLFVNNLNINNYNSVIFNSTIIGSAVLLSLRETTSNRYLVF